MGFSIWVKIRCDACVFSSPSEFDTEAVDSGLWVALGDFGPEFADSVDLNVLNCSCDYRATPTTNVGWHLGSSEGSQFVGK